ncbi:PLC-like phosphodiesterase [Laetiporus sulphureus 93-53]|uniref:PLC-like phosphodiesterase n=1 Tax=Laetiporus sulphureus 93-53 TaxID=1314785 RepID=A0A165DI63_9APHY|nr:PLC-like phosphodiesterase [Laetiporus sulphureus 93-53]KZT04935.1 PLC-like phosphodiesterase [Laetiporus sulphureus 93-53]
MAERGTLLLVNATPYEWTISSVSEHGMESWPFVSDQTVVSAGNSATFSIEFKEGFFHRADDDVAYATFNLVGTPYSFQVQAIEQQLRIWLQAIATTGNDVDGVIDLAWDSKGIMPFFLAGRSGAFSSNNPPMDWMQSNLSTLGSRPLRHLCMPGTHDSGMSTLRAHSALVTHKDTITQVHTIGGQLALGARYFDCRPVIRGGQYVSGHYADVKDVGWMGGTGQSFADIVREINDFTADNAELVVLNVSHDLNTDASRSFTQEEWDAFLELLMGLERLYVAPDPASVDLTLLPLEAFIGNGDAAVVVIAEPDAKESVSLGAYVSRGVYRYAQLDAYNSYSDTHELEKMVHDQLDKMWNVRQSPGSQYFLLSWTLTQDALEAIGAGETILSLAAPALPRLYTKLLPACSPNTYPNIIYLDRFHTSDVVALAMAVNALAGGLIRTDLQDESMNEILEV